MKAYVEKNVRFLATVIYGESQLTLFGIAPGFVAAEKTLTGFAGLNRILQNLRSCNIISNSVSTEDCLKNPSEFLFFKNLYL